MSAARGRRGEGNEIGSLLIQITQSGYFVFSNPKNWVSWSDPSEIQWSQDVENEAAVLLPAGGLGPM